MSEKKDSKFVEEKTITYRGFKDAEEAKKFLDDMRGEMEKSFDRIFEGTRQLLDTVFRYPDMPTQCICPRCGYTLQNPTKHCRNISCPKCGSSLRPNSVDNEIEYHQQRIKRLEEKKKLMLPAKEKTKVEDS